MYEILPETTGHIVALKAMDRLTDADFEVLEPAVDRMIEEAAPAKVFLDWTELTGWDGKGEARSFRFWIHNWGLVEKVAIVSSDKFLSDVLRLKQTLSRSQVRHFAVFDADTAWTWLQDD